MDPFSTYFIGIKLEIFITRICNPHALLLEAVERNGIEINDSVSELGSLTTANLMEKVRGLQNLAYQLGLDECEYPDPFIQGCMLYI